MAKDNKKPTKKANNKPVVVLSFDGTVMDTEPAILATYRELFDRHNKNDMFTKEIQLAALDDSVYSVMEYCFPEEDTKKMVQEYNSWQRNHLSDLIQPMHFIKDLLKWLKKHEYKIATVSSRERASVIELLEHARMMQYFDVVIGGTNSKKNTNSTEGLFTALKLLDAKSCVYVSDSSAEIMIGKDAGVFTVGFAHNPDKANSIVEEKPDFVTADLIQIKKLLKGDALWLAYEIQYPNLEEIKAKEEKRAKKKEEKAKLKAAKAKEKVKANKEAKKTTQKKVEKKPNTKKVQKKTTKKVPVKKPTKKN